ncbi:MAG: hypothetical protein WD530_01360 [Vicingaceae bacterium]
MDSSLEHFKGTNNRRKERLATKNRKYSQKNASTIKIKYKHKLSHSPQLSKTERLALRKRIIDEEKQKLTKRLVVVSIIILVLTFAFVWLVF